MQNMAERKTEWEAQAWLKEIKDTTWLLNEVLDPANSFGINMGFEVKVYSYDPTTRIVHVKPVAGTGEAWVRMDLLEHIEETGGAL